MSELSAIYLFQLILNGAAIEVVGYCLVLPILHQIIILVIEYKIFIVPVKHDLRNP